MCSALSGAEYTSKDVVLYYSPRCPHSQEVISYIKANHLQVSMKDALHDTEAKRELELYGGHLIVPCLMVDKSPIYEAPCIIEWLSEHKSELTASKIPAKIIQ